MSPKYFLRLLISIVLIITMLAGSIPFFGVQTIALANDHPDSPGSPFSETTNWDNMAGNSFSGTIITIQITNATITIDEDGNVIEREFNALNLVSAVTADDILLGFVYDRTGRLVSMTDATGETSFLLDPLYRIREVTDSFGRVTAYDYDPAGNLLSITYPDASVVTYTHNRDNQILTIRDRDGGITRNVYDSYGRLDRQYLPNGGHTEFSYNGLNQITMQREIFNARITRQFTYAYDVTGLLQHETIQFFGVDNEDTSRMLRYDANGRLYLTTDTLMGRVEYDYDSMGNLIRENRAGNITTFTYNAMNQLVSRTTPTGQYTYTYDRRGNLISESRNGTPVRTFEFDALGRMIRGTNELGETSAYEYNALNLRVANVQHLLPGHEGGHGWDVNGYLNDEPNSPGSRYIDVNRQALAGLPAGVWLDALDGYEWDVEALRDIETLRNAEGGVPYIHQRIFKDNFGLNRNSGVVRQEFVIDYVMGFNQDLMVIEAGGWETVFVYGTPLQRISQHTAKSSDIISGVPAVGGAIDPHGNVAADIAVVPTYQVLYYRLDFRNSTSQMQLPNGQYIAWTGYDEWGVVTSPDSHDMNMAGVQDSIRFTSYTKDRVLGLYYAQNRWYDATTRRFTAVDPIKDGDNWYIYVGNNPVNWIDPDGLERVDITINGRRMIVYTDRAPDVVRMLNTFDSSARRVGSTNQIQVYNYRDRSPTQVSFGSNTTVARILEQAGFINTTGARTRGAAAFFNIIECGMVARADNKYQHHLGLTDADIERFIEGLTDADIQTMSNFGTLKGTNEAMYIFFIFETFGRAEGERILQDLNWPGHSATAVGRSYSLNQQGFSIQELEQAQRTQFDSQVQALVIYFALRTGGRAPNNPNLQNRASLKNLSTREADRIVRSHGYRDAHDFKEAFVGRNEVSRFNIKVDTNTGEIFLEGIQNRAQIATGLFR